MLESAANIDLTSLVVQIDGLSTRLILNGVATLGPCDFDRLRETAAECELRTVADRAKRLAEDLLAGATSSQADLTRIVSAGLEELRRLLDEPTANSDASLSAVAQSERLDERNAGSAAKNALAGDEDLIREFITESTDHLTAIESQLLLLEAGNSTTETLNAIFRGFHTIKGLAGFLEFAEIQSLAHEIETLLDLARTAQLTVTPAIADVVLESTDVVRHELAVIAHKLAGKQPLPSKVDSSLLDRIRQAAIGGSSSPQQNLAPSPPSDVEDTAIFEPRLQERRTGDATSVRIDTAKLDQLMDTVGEMVIAQTLIGHSPTLAAASDARLQRNLTHLARITADVQRIATSMRMVPIGLQFQKTARLVRDLARRAGKQVAFEISGEDTELDKTISEALSDPLLHMVRNSIDHGIETPEERIALGKNPTARIRVAACHQSGQIVVTITDDGRGLNREKILAKARHNGLIDPCAPPPADNELFPLIFEAGFSTADKVTDISGRGVGMDVVRQHVQKLRGRIDIQSKAGEGATFSIKLPLTLAIIEGLVVVVGQHRYILPIFAVREMFRPTGSMLSTVQGTGEMTLVRSGLLPVVRLHRLFAIVPNTADLAEGTLIVAESEGRSFCLFVDEVLGKQEVVIKSLGHRFRNVTGVAGCAILGDGRVGLILDIDGIYKGRT